MMKRILGIMCCMMMLMPATARNYEVEVGEFTKLKVPNNLNVVYHCNPDSTGMAVLTDCEPGMASSVIFSNNGTLKIEVATDFAGLDNLPTVHVYSSFLQQVESSSEKRVSILSPAPVPEFKAKLYGNGELYIEGISATKVKAQLMTGHGTVTVSGTCDKANLDLTGTGEVRADELLANEVKCSIWGTGAIYCHPVKKLRSDGIGSTRIYYLGHPESVKKTGGGKFIPLD